MKKILLFSVLFLMVAASCKKDNGNPSTVVSVSFPTINPIQIYFSFPMGSVNLPKASQIATAFDSVYRDVCSIVLIDSNVHVTTPGLYQATLIATSKYGYITNYPYYVAITNLSAGYPNLAGNYSIGTTPNTVTNIATGYYSMNNFDGLNDDTTAVFAIITDSTIAFAGDSASIYVPVTGNWDAFSYAPVWPALAAYDYYGYTGTVTYATGDTTINYTALSSSKP